MSVKPRSLDRSIPSFGSLRPSEEGVSAELHGPHLPILNANSIYIQKHDRYVFHPGNKSHRALSLDTSCNDTTFLGWEIVYNWIRCIVCCSVCEV